MLTSHEAIRPALGSHPVPPTGPDGVGGKRAWVLVRPERVHIVLQFAHLCKTFRSFDFCCVAPYDDCDFAMRGVSSG